MAKTATILNQKPATEKVNTGLADKDRKAIAEQLSDVLADTYALTVKSHIYHWNVVGPLFHSLHVMTEEQYEDLFKATDVIAERIRALGYRAPTSGNRGGEIVVELDSVSKSAHDMVADLIKAHEATIRKMRNTAEMAEDAEDFVSHDMLVGRMTEHEKTVWMLRSVVAD